MEKNTKIDFKKETSEEIRNTIDKSNEYIEQGTKEIKNRGDETKGELLIEYINGMMVYGVMILFLGIFYMGAVPQYFGVNDEFMNPSNSSFGYDNKIAQASNIIKEEIFYDFHYKGSQNPTFWFWMFWFAVFMVYILPAYNLVIGCYKRWKKEKK